MFIYRDEYYKKEKTKKPGIAELIIAKNRAGSSGEEIDLLFQPEYSRFRNMAEDYREEEE